MRDEMAQEHRPFARFTSVAHEAEAQNGNGFGHVVRSVPQVPGGYLFAKIETGGVLDDAIDTSSIAPGWFVGLASPTCQDSTLPRPPAPALHAVGSMREMRLG